LPEIISFLKFSIRKHFSKLRKIRNLPFYRIATFFALLVENLFYNLLKLILKSYSISRVEENDFRPEFRSGSRPRRKLPALPRAASAQLPNLLLSSNNVQNNTLPTFASTQEPTGKGHLTNLIIW
jgi:hypothetical protein